MVTKAHRARAPHSAFHRMHRSHSQAGAGRVRRRAEPTQRVSEAVALHRCGRNAERRRVIDLIAVSRDFEEHRAPSDVSSRWRIEFLALRPKRQRQDHLTQPDDRFGPSDRAQSGSRPRTGQRERMVAITRQKLAWCFKPFTCCPP
jgi:hypothetical protein